MTPPAGPIHPHHAGSPSRVIQGFFPGGTPRIIQASPVRAPPVRPPAPAPIQARPVHGALQPATRPGQPPRPILPTNTLQPRPAQPGTPVRPQAPKPILPQQANPAAVQPQAGNAFPLPGNFTLKPRGSGQPLPESIQKKMASLFNTSFADVRVHVGHEAPSIGALAFTHGTDLYFAPGQYNPQSTQGQQLLGHELTHVVQQRAGRVRNPLGSGVAVVQNPALEAEAERMGMRAATAHFSVQMKSGGGPSPAQVDPAGVNSTPRSNLSGAVPIHVETESREQAIQRSRGFWSGLVGGAALGGAVAGPAGALGGAIGGAVLGPVFEWWNNLPAQDPLPFTATDLNVGRQNLRQTAGPVPYIPPPDPANQILVTGRQNLRQTAGPVRRVFPVTTADLIDAGHLAAGRQNLTQTAGPAPYVPPPHPADQILATGRQNLAHTQIVHQLDTVDWPDAGWQFTVPFDPVVVDISQQTKGKRLDEMILLPAGVRLGRVLFRIGGQVCPGNTVLRAGAWVIQYRYETLTQQMSQVRTTILHIKPTIYDLMTEMGFVRRGTWRWELAWDQHGTLHRWFHVTVPIDEQLPLGRMDDISDILQRIFPLGSGMTGTHMSIECRMGNSPSMNNAAYFVNGSEKYPKGYSQQEGQTLVNACRTRLNDWKSRRAQSLRDALSRL